MLSIRLASLRYGCLALLPDPMPVAIMAEHEDTFVADVQLALSAPPAPSGLPLPALRPRRSGAGVPWLRLQFALFVKVVPRVTYVLILFAFVIFSMGLLGVAATKRIRDRYVGSSTVMAERAACVLV